MTLIEACGCTLITFGPVVAMFSLTVADDPIKVIIFIVSAFFWLLSFLASAACWAVVETFCDYLIIGAYLAVLSQEGFRYLFHKAKFKAQAILRNVVISSIESSSTHSQELSDESSRSKGEVQVTSTCLGIEDSTQFSYESKTNYIQLKVSGIAFGFMNAAFLMSNALSDSIGPGSVGLDGSSQYFLVTSALSALAFIILNICWSVLMSQSVDKSEPMLLAFTVATHLIATSITLLNAASLQILSISILYLLICACGILSFKATNIDLKTLLGTLRNGV